MRIDIRKVTLKNNDGWGTTVRCVLPEADVRSSPYQELIGSELLSLWLPDGSEVYESVTGETCVRVPQSGFGTDGMRMSLSEAASEYARYVRPGD